MCVCRCGVAQLLYVEDFLAPRRSDWLEGGRRRGDDVRRALHLRVAEVDGSVLRGGSEARLRAGRLSWIGREWREVSQVAAGARSLPVDATASHKAPLRCCGEEFAPAPRRER